MTGKQRFLDTMSFKPVDRVPFMEIALWGQTLDRWIAEGAPSDLDSSFMKGNPYFGLEGYDTADIDAINPYPSFEERVLEEDGDHVVHIDRLGRTRMARKSGTAHGTRMSMDQYLGWAVKDRAGFRELRHRYEGDPAERYPADWDSIAARLGASERPITLLDPLSGTFGFYSMLRNWIGTEPLSYLFFDDPGLVHDCLELLGDFIVRVLTRAVTEVRFDYYFVHEDMAGKGGPLMGPNLFREFLLPHYKRFIAFLKSHGVRLVLVDTDGDFEALLPVFLEAGVDGFGPMEVAAGMDPAGMRKKHGKTFSMIGGVDKREIAKGRRAIDAAVATMAAVVRDGGYIPTIDHSIPPDVSLENFRYYLQEKRRVIFTDA